MVGCAPSESSAKLIVAAEVQNPVTGGVTINTAVLGEVHLGAPLLEANYVGEEEIYISDITFKDSDDSPFLQLSPQMFLQFALRSEKSKGMSAEDFLEQIGSDSLQPGNTVYLVAETEEGRIAHRFRIGYRDDPDAVFLLYSWQGQPEQNERNRNQFEIRTLLEPTDDSSKGVKIWNRMESSDVLHVGDPLFPTERIQSFNDGCLRMKERSYLITRRARQGIPPNPIYSDKWLVQTVVATWKTDNGEMVGEKSYLWPSAPGLHLELEAQDRIRVIRNSFKSLKYAGFKQSTEVFSRGGHSGSRGSL